MVSRSRSVAPSARVRAAGASNAHRVAGRARAPWVLCVALSLVASGCSRITAVDAPITLFRDNRLTIVQPRDSAEVRLPVTIKWEVTEFPPTGGNHFALFLDRAPLGPRKRLKLVKCAEGPDAPIIQDCEDDRETVFQTPEMHYAFDCLQPTASSGRRRNVHEVNLILLDGEGYRDGEASASIRFEVNERDVKACRGRGPWP